MIEIPNNDLFMNAFNFSAIGMAIVSMDGKLLKVNASLCKIMEFSTSELEQMTFQEITHPDDLELDLNNLNKMLTEETQYYEMEKRYLKKNGCIAWGLLSVSLVKDENNNPLYFISQIQDITEQKRIEKELQKSNDRFKAIFEKSGIGIILRDRQGKVVEVNPTFLEMVGYTKEDVAKSINLVYHDDIGKEKKLFSELINGQRDYYQMEKRFLHKNGHILFTTITVTATRNLEEVYALSMIHDISDRKHSEKLIKQSEERYRALVESSPNAIVVHQEGKIVYANPRFTHFLKVTSEDDIIGQHILQFVHPDYQEIVKERIQHLERNQSVGSLEEKYVLLDGSIVDVEVIATPIMYMDKPAFQVIISDISKRKEMEKKLNKSQELYRSVVANIKEVIFHTDAEGIWTFLNPAWEEITGFSIEESIGRHFHDYVDPDDREQNDKLFQSWIQGKQKYYRKEIRYLNKEVGYCWVEVFARKTLNDQGEMIGTLGTLNDITKRKESEDELKASEERFRLLAEYSSDMITLHDVEGTYLYASPACKEILQYDEEELVGHGAYLFIHPDDIEIVKKSNQTLLTTGYSVTTYRIRRKDGEYVWFESATKLLNEPLSGGQKLIVVSRNISERKLVEQRLQEANELLQHLSNIDGLTGVSNRRAFDERLKIEWNRGSRNSTSLSLIMLDIDYFKAYNDTYGHQGGDGCLKQVASVIQETLGRPTDLLCRYGGEEFGVILPETNETGAKAVGEKIRNAIEALKIPHSGSKILPWVTISAGTATMTPSVYTSYMDLISNADKAVYKAKFDGRNCVRSYE